MALVLRCDRLSKHEMKALIAAEYSGVQVQVAKNFQMNPLGKFPVLETPEGTVFGNNVIARYVTLSKANNPLYGTSLIEHALIEQWMEFAATAIDAHTVRLLYSRMGYMPLIPQVEEFGISSLKWALTALNTHLATNDFLVGNAVTLVDIVMVCNLLPGFTFLMTKAFTSEFIHVERYFWALVNQPNFKKIMGKVKQAESVPAVASARKAALLKEAAKPKEAKKEVEKEAPKPKVEAAAEEEEAPKPKAKNPLDLLPPSPMILDESNDMELNEWTMVDISDEAQKERVSAMIEVQEPFEGDAKCFK